MWLNKNYVEDSESFLHHKHTQAIVNPLPFLKNSVSAESSDLHLSQLLLLLLLLKSPEGFLLLLPLSLQLLLSLGLLLSPLLLLLLLLGKSQSCCSSSGCSSLLLRSLLLLMPLQCLEFLLLSSLLFLVNMDDNKVSKESLNNLPCNLLPATAESAHLFAKEVLSFLPLFLLPPPLLQSSPSFLLSQSILLFFLSPLCFFKFSLPPQSLLLKSVNAT